MRLAQVSHDARYSVNEAGEVFGPRGKMKPMYSRGYARVEISGKGYRVHRLVAEAFIEKPAECSEVNHIDCDKSNNKVSNLEWVTRSENLSHAYRNNLIPRMGAGERCARAKLSAEQVGFILKSYKPRDKVFGATAMAANFGVSPSCINRVVTGKNWRGG